MPKGSSRPDNRGERKVIEGMKMLREKGMGRRRNLFPGAEGTAPGVGTFSPFDKEDDVAGAVARGNRGSEYEAEDMKTKGYAAGGMVRGCKGVQMSGKGFRGNY